MDFLTCFRQMARTPLKTLLYILVLLLLTAFFTVSANLYRNSEENLRLADETYSTIAVMELYGDVDPKGTLQQEPGEDYAGYLPTAVIGYDISPIVSAPGVERYDLRTRYGAYVPDTPALAPERISGFEGIEPVYKRDIIRFTVEEDAPLGMMSTPVSVTVHESAAGIYRYGAKLSLSIFMYEQHYEPYAEALALLNGGAAPEAGAVTTLKAGVEYIASVRVGDSVRYQEEDGLFAENGAGMMPDEYGAERYVSYSAERGESLVYDAAPGQPYWLLPYADVVNDPALSAYFAAAMEACAISVRSFGVMATEDMMGVPAFHLGSTFIREGRVFTEEEYGAGARVCMVSTDVAAAQGWSVGDRVDMHFYEFDGFLNETHRRSELNPAYNKDTEGFFDEGEYEIVGIYELRPVTGISTVSESAMSVPWNTIFVPNGSIENAPADGEQPVSGALLTLWIENGRIGDFMERMDALGLTAEKPGGYEARFTFYDQGYSRVQQSLEALSGTSELLFILSGALLAAAAVLMAFFHTLSQKQNLGVMRLMGCGRCKAFFSLFGNAAFIGGAGMCAGAAVGSALTEIVGAFILETGSSVPEAHLAYSAYIAAGQNVELEFALGPGLGVSLSALSAALLLFLLSATVFLLRYLLKEPRALLPQGHE